MLIWIKQCCTLLSFAPSVFVRVVAEEEEFLVVVIVATTLTEGLFLLTEYPAHLNTPNNSRHNENDVCFINLFFVIP